jgi:RNA polymerase sigma-70 factor (ECF subfamily)
MPFVDPLLPLLEAAREGNDVALAELVRKTQPVLWRLCSTLGYPEDPEDLVQETFIRMLRAMHSFRGDAPVRAWLMVIARRVCADSVRRSQRQRRLLERIRDSPPDPVTMSAGAGHVDDLVAELEPNRREAFVLTQQIGLSYEEAAEVCACPIGTIRSRVARARADLQAAIAASETA